jgi:hypothetical protein
MIKRNRFSEQIAAYANTSGAFRNFVQNAGDELFRGDPKRAADVIVKMVEADKMPHRIVLGSDAYSMLPSRQDSMRSASSTKREAPSPRALISRSNIRECPAIVFNCVEEINEDQNNHQRAWSGKVF